MLTRPTAIPRFKVRDGLPSCKRSLSVRGRDSGRKRGIGGAGGVHSRDDSQTTYEADLRQLRKDMGCTWERLIAAGALYAALQRRVAARSREPTVDACIDELRALVNDLSDPKQREPLLVALRLDPRYQELTLTRRRRSYNNELRKARSDVDARTLERRENSAIRTVASHLAAEDGFRQPSVGSRSETPPRQERQFRTERREIWYRFGPSRVLREMIVALRIVAVVPGAARYGAHFGYAADMREGVVEIEPMFGCESDGTPIFRDGLTFARLRIPRPIPVGEEHQIVYRVLVRSEHECKPILASLAGRNDSLIIKRVEFHPDAIPDRVWTFAHLTYPDVVHEPKQVELSQEPGRFVAAQWQEVQMGLYYGIAWEWPQSVSGR